MTIQELLKQANYTKRDPDIWEDRECCHCKYNGGKKDEKIYCKNFGIYVDVQDICDCYFDIYKTPEMKAKLNSLGDFFSKFN